jgi:putative transposase
MPEQIQVTERQETILHQIIRRAKSPQNLVLRVKIVLGGRQYGLRNTQIGRDLNASSQTVSTWRGRWLAAYDLLGEIEDNEDDRELEGAIIQVLADLPRSGAPATFTAEQVCQIIAVACEAPELSGRPITEWTPRELTDEVIKREIVVSISSSQVERFLKRGGTATPSQPVLAKQQTS